MRFDWNRDKEAVNVAKHGVDFSEARSAFADPLLVLAADKGHSQKEPRLFCIGRSGRGGIDSRCANRSSASLADLTVCPSASQHDVFTPCFASPIGARPFALSAQAIGVKASPARTKSMKKKTVRYTGGKGEIIGELRAIPKGELPSLDQLVGKLHQKQKVTLALDGEAISFFKREASKRHTSYQRMIRNLVLAYARQHTR